MDPGGLRRPFALVAGRTAVVATISIVVTRFQDLHFFIVRSVHEPMFVVDPPGPVPGQLTLERLRLPNTRERVTLNISDKPGDPTSHLAVRRQPKQEVLPGVRIDVDPPHSLPPAISSSSSIDLVWFEGTVRLALSRATASMSRRAFSGERSR